MEMVCTKPFRKRKYILRVNHPNLISFSFASNCTVKVKLSKDKEQTLVELTQKEIPLDNNSKENIRLGYIEKYL